MAESKVKTNYSDAYNPYAHLKQSLREDGLPAYKPYEKDAVVQLDKEGHTILVPEVHLDANAYRDWFLKAYPDGRTEIIRHTMPPVLTEDKSFVYPAEIFEVKFYLTEDGPMKTCGWGRAETTENGEFDPISSAISKAYKNGMRNMGFGVDLDTDTILDSLPKYVDRTVTGKKLTVETLPEEPDKAVNTPASVKENPVISEEENNAQEMSQSSSQLDEIESYFKAKEEKEIAQTETAAAKETESIPSADNAATQDTDYNPGDVVFSLIPGVNSPLSKFEGMKLSAIKEKEPRILDVICKPTYPWQTFLTEDVYKAIYEIR